MRRQETLPLSEILKDFVKEQGIGLQMQRVSLFQAWDNVVGEAAAKATSYKFFRDGILYCTISSSMLRTQLGFQAEAFRKELNAQMGEELVKKIVLK